MLFSAGVEPNHTCDYIPIDCMVLSHMNKKLSKMVNKLCVNGNDVTVWSQGSH